jgi:AcrR family transcriptional regulator
VPNTAVAAVPGEGPVLNLRNRRKLETRRALQAAALYLFAEQGYEETTVAEIAARAQVGLRTFFLHFPTKEAVLFNGSREAFPDLFQLIAASPPELSDLAALEFALIQLHESVAPDREMHHKMTQLLIRAAATSSVVRGRRTENAEKIAAVAASAIAVRRGEESPSLATVTLAEAAMRVHHLAVTEWAASSPDDLIPIVRRRLRVLREVGADASRVAPLRGKGRPPRRHDTLRGAAALFSVE